MMLPFTHDYAIGEEADVKVLYLGADASAPPLKKTWKETMAELDRAVQRFKIKIARLAEDSECN